MAFTINSEHSNTRGFTMAKHTFFCINDTCDNETPLPYSECEWCARFWADQAEEDIWCSTSNCTCGPGGRMCESCSEDYKEPCRSCGEPSHLWTDNMHCRECFLKLHGNLFPPARAPPSSVVQVPAAPHTQPPLDCHDCGAKFPVALMYDPVRCPSCVLSARCGRPNSVASPPPLPASPRDIQDDIDHIIEKLETTQMTPDQTADWQRLLDTRKRELAEADAEMWEGYDQDDLNKLDRQLYHGGW